jgi:hypothetical protein
MKTEQHDFRYNYTLKPGETVDIPGFTLRHDKPELVNRRIVAKVVIQTKIEVLPQKIIDTNVSV